MFGLSTTVKKNLEDIFKELTAARTWTKNRLIQALHDNKKNAPHLNSSLLEEEYANCNDPNLKKYTQIFMDELNKLTQELSLLPANDIESAQQRWQIKIRIVMLWRSLDYWKDPLEEYLADYTCEVKRELCWPSEKTTEDYLKAVKSMHTLITYHYSLDQPDTDEIIKQLITHHTNIDRDTKNFTRKLAIGTFIILTLLFLLPILVVAGSSILSAITLLAMVVVLCGIISLGIDEGGHRPSASKVACLTIIKHIDPDFKIERPADNSYSFFGSLKSLFTSCVVEEDEQRQSLTS